MRRILTWYMIQIALAGRHKVVTARRQLEIYLVVIDNDGNLELLAGEQDAHVTDIFALTAS